jgi:hypothetical protein
MQISVQNQIIMLISVQHEIIRSSAYPRSVFFIFAYKNILCPQSEGIALKFVIYAPRMCGTLVVILIWEWGQEGEDAMEAEAT